MNAKRALYAVLVAALAAAAVSCSAGPPPRDIAEARLALQDAKNAGADQRATHEYDAAVAHLNVAQNTWNEKKDAPTAAHWARLAEAEARQAQYLAVGAAASESLRRETERKQRGELAVRGGGDRGAPGAREDGRREARRGGGSSGGGRTRPNLGRARPS